jgi:dipeptidyl aminopeptidase/acylaminoacyl peptidase
MRWHLRICTAAGLIAVLVPIPPAIAQSGPRTPFQAIDIFRLEQASDTQISPDGDHVAYVRLTNDIATDSRLESIWLVDTRTGNQRPLGGIAATGSQPRWCPAGGRLAFTAEPPGQPRGLFTYALATRRFTRVATLKSGGSALSWSPDCSRIAFVALVPEPVETLGAPLARPADANWAEPVRLTTHALYRQDGKGNLPPGHDHLFVVAAAGGVPRQLTSGPYRDAGPIAWAPDGRSLLFTGRRGKDWERDSYRSAIYRASLDNGALTRLTSLPGPVESAAVSPDGRSIAFSGYDDSRRRSYENRRIYVMDADGGDARIASGSVDRSLYAPVWAPDGRSLYARMEDRGVTQVVRFAPGGAVSVVADRLADDGLDLPYSGGMFSLARDGTVAFPQGAPDRPADVALSRDGTTRRLTRLNDALLDGRTLGSLASLAVSAADGTPMDAWMLTPPGFDPARRYPLILEIHGGPFLHYGPYFSTDDQLYAAAGYVVVYANARGSTSYGETFANAIDRDYPGVDYDDQMRVVDAAIARGFVDPARLFVTGGSAGGLMTAWIVGKTGRFSAAASQRPVINWTSLTLTSDSGYKSISNWAGRTPWDDQPWYWAHSPLSLVGNVTTPTLMIAGEKDIRTPLAEAEQFYAALQLRGVPTGLIVVPGAFHDMAARPSHAATKANAVIAWFNRYDRGR